jgi:hypothetical protein
LESEPSWRYPNASIPGEFLRGQGRN